MTHPGSKQKVEAEASPIVGIEFHLTGTYPLLQHRFGEMAEAGLAKSTKGADKVKREMTPRDTAESNCYRLGDGSIGHPSQAIVRAMCDAGVNYKMKGSRQSLRFVVPAAVRSLDEYVKIVDPVTLEPVKDIEVDSRSVVNQKVKARVMCYRARIENWTAVGRVSLDTELLDEEMAQKLLTDAGRRLGIGAFRPQSRGPFGTFRVTKFARVDIDI